MVPAELDANGGIILLVTSNHTDFSGYTFIVAYPAPGVA